MTPSTLYTSTERSSRVGRIYVLHSQLVVLHLEQTVIYCVPHHQSCEMSFLVLTDSVCHISVTHLRVRRLCLPKNPSKGLEFYTMIPPEIDGYDSVCHGQIEALTTTFKSSNHNSKPRIWSIKVLNGFVPSLCSHVPSILAKSKSHVPSVLRWGFLPEQKTNFRLHRSWQ